ncbi:hypothetical protein [Rubellimicrobium roseum]|uniref:Uncharacterized protein n=1 Tax=Rubellimicrobium roseum TaxID=687525 RepID=A0A5C4NMV7_9RHOB|nr:hypothetical protein [Rubellimicrobium roseum]TNC73719.1 hypothetical protein FHG71_04340 [Rubellimicrobium roseum]
MATTHLDRPRSVLGILMDVIHAHPASTMGRPGQGRGRGLAEEEILDHLPPHLRDDMGLPPVPPPEPEPPSVARARHRAARWGI